MEAPISYKITRNRIVISFQGSPRKPLRRWPSLRASTSPPDSGLAVHFLGGRCHSFKGWFYSPRRNCTSIFDLKLNVSTKNSLQGGPSGRGTQLVYIKSKVPPQWTLLILKHNSYQSRASDSERGFGSTERLTYVRCLSWSQKWLDPSLWNFQGFMREGGRLSSEKKFGLKTFEKNSFF